MALLRSLGEIGVEHSAFSLNPQADGFSADCKTSLTRSLAASGVR